MDNPLDNTIYDIVDITPGDPAAGTNHSNIAPINARIQLIAVRFTLTTAAAVADRLPTVHGTGPVQTFGATAPSVVQTASNTIIYHFGFCGAPGVSFPALLVAQCPLSRSLILRPGELMNITILGIQGADQLSNILYRWKQWRQ